MLKFCSTQVVLVLLCSFSLILSKYFICQGKFYFLAKKTVDKRPELHTEVEKLNGACIIAYQWFASTVTVYRGLRGLRDFFTDKHFSQRQTQKGALSRRQY